MFGEPRSRTQLVTTVAEGVSWPYRVLFTPDLKTVVLPDLRNHEVRFVDRATRREISPLSAARLMPWRALIAITGTSRSPSASSSRRTSATIASRRSSGTVSMWLSTTTITSEWLASFFR